MKNKTDLKTHWAVQDRNLALMFQDFDMRFAIVIDSAPLVDYGRAANNEKDLLTRRCSIRDTVDPPHQPLCRRSFVLWMRLLLLMLPAAVQAQFTYTTNNGTITISGYIGPGGSVKHP